MEYKRMGKLDYWWTQVLVGPGSLRKFMKSIGKVGTNVYMYCDRVDDVVHTF